MLFEKSLQPNCSELVSHLGWETDKELQAGIKKIMATGLHMVVEVNDLDPVDICKMYVIPMTEKDVDRIRIGTLKDEDDEGFEDKASFLLPYLKLQALKQGVYIRLRFMEKKVKEGWAKWGEDEGAKITWGDGYDENPGVVVRATQHCSVEDFPAFTKIRKLFRKPWHCHDGGSPYDYELWLAKNKIKD